MTKREQKNELQRTREVLARAGVAAPEGKLDEVVGDIAAQLINANRLINALRFMLEKR